MVQRERVQNSHRAPTREKAPERGWCLPIGSIEGGSGHPELSWEDVREREPRRCLRQEVVILMLGLAINPNTCPENIMGGPIIAKVPKVVNEKVNPPGIDLYSLGMPSGDRVPENPLEPLRAETDRSPSW